MSQRPVRPRALLPRSPRVASWAAAALTLALLWAQALGLAHRISHGLPHPTAHAHGHGHDPLRAPALSRPAPQSHAQADRPAGATARSGLFGHQSEDSAECRLFDQAGLASAVPAAAWQVAQAPPCAWLPLPVAQRGSDALAGLPQARAPPLTA